MAASEPSLHTHTPTSRGLQHLRQIWTLHAALVIPIDLDPLRTCGDLIKPIDYRSVTAILFNQASNTVRPSAARAVTGHAQHIELADEITEHDCAVAGF